MLAPCTKAIAGSMTSDKLRPAEIDPFEPVANGRFKEADFSESDGKVVAM